MDLKVIQGMLAICLCMRGLWGYFQFTRRVAKGVLAEFCNDFMKAEQ
jgi:hypothetical protein